VFRNSSLRCPYDLYIKILHLQKFYNFFESPAAQHLPPRKSVCLIVASAKPKPFLSICLQLRGVAESLHLQTELTFVTLFGLLRLSKSSLALLPGLSCGRCTSRPALFSSQIAMLEQHTQYVDLPADTVYSS
jgi:hypothetical protein